VRDRRRRLLFGIAVSAAVLVGGIYLLAVQTRWGQRLDATAVRGRHVLSRRDLHAASQFHNTIDIAGFLLIGTAIVLVAFFRRRPLAGAAAAAIIAGALATSELLKHTLPRPSLRVVDLIRHTPTYPSGHTTLAMALGVGATLVAPMRWRTSVSFFAALFTSAIGCSVVATASHRPSDAIGAVFVVTAWTSAVAAFVLGTHRRQLPSGMRSLSVSRSMALGGAALLATSFIVAAITTLAIHSGQLTAVELGRAFIGAAAAITGSTFACTAALLFSLHDIDLGRPRAAHPSTDATEMHTRSR